MTDESKILEDAMTRLLTARCRPADVRGSEGRWMSELWNALVDMGVPWLGIPDSLGGSGGEVDDAALAVRIAARHTVPLPIAEMTLVACPALASAGIPMPAGASLSCATDPLRAEQAGAGLLVSGTAYQVAWAANCDYTVAICDVDGANQIVVIRCSDMAVQSERNAAGEARCRITLDRVRPVEFAATAWSTDVMLARAAAAATLAISAAADRVVELSIGYANTRQQFGRPIGMFQAVAHLLARMAAAAAAAQGAARLALRALRDNDILLAGSAKTVASETAGTVAELAHQLHGAIGMTREHRLHLLTRRLWSWRDEYGSDRYWSRREGQHLVATATDPWSDLIDAR
jgi:acyl-CoA dehydrogenase